MIIKYSWREKKKIQSKKNLPFLFFEFVGGLFGRECRAVIDWCANRVLV